MDCLSTVPVALHKAISDQPFFSIQGSLGEIVIDGFEGGCRLYALDGNAKMVENRDVLKNVWTFTII
jgi:hypothetical protein